MTPEPKAAVRRQVCRRIRRCRLGFVACSRRCFVLELSGKPRSELPRRAMALKMPEADEGVLGRRAEIVAALRAIVPGEGVIDSAAEMVPYESDGLTAYRQPPMVVVLPETTEQVSRVLRYCHEQPHQGGAARRRHLAVRRRAAAEGRRAARARQVQAHPRDRLRQPLRRRRAGRHQSRDQPGGRRIAASITRRIRRRRSPAPSAATSRKTPAACTA